MATTVKTGVVQSVRSDNSGGFIRIDGLPMPFTLANIRDSSFVLREGMPVEVETEVVFPSGPRITRIIGVPNTAQPGEGRPPTIALPRTQRGAPTLERPRRDRPRKHPTGAASEFRRESLQGPPSPDAPSLSENLQRTAGQAYAAALVARQQGNYESARQLFKEAINLGVNAPDIYSAYASMEKDLGNRADAVAILQRGIRIFPQFGKLYEDYGTLKRASGDLKDAADVFRTGISKSSPPHAALHRCLAQVLIALGEGKIDEATTQRNFARRHELWDTDDESRYHVALIRFKHPRVALAFDLFEQLRFPVQLLTTSDRPEKYVDVVADCNDPEFIGSYDLSGKILTRCFLQEQVSNRDIRDLAADCDIAKIPGLNKDVAFVVLDNSASIRDELYSALERPGTEAAIVPLEEGEFSAPRTASSFSAALRHTLDQWLYRRDLYKGNLPVSGRRFFGREQELSELFKAIDSGTHLGVFGLRKVGKTSLLKQVAEKRTRDIVLYIDLLTTPAAIRDCNYLYWNIANALASRARTKYPSVAQSITFRLGGRYRAYGDIPSVAAVSVDFDADIRSIVEALLSDSNTSDVKVILLFDEVETLLPIEHVQAGFSGYIDFFGYLRGIAQQYGVLVSIVTAANPSICEQPTWEGRDNPVFRFYHEMFLPPFTENECDEMVEKLGRGMGLAFTRQSLADIFQKTGGHPFITRQFCSRLAATYRERPLEVKPLHVAGAVDEFLSEDGPTFAEILARLDRYFPSEKQALISITRGRDSYGDLKEILGRGVAQDLHHLTGYQLVRRDRDRYKLTIGLLGLWIKRYWDGDES